MKDVNWSTFFRHLDRSMGIYFSDIRELTIEDDGEVVDAQYELKEEFDCLKDRDVKADLRLLVKLVKGDLIDKLDNVDEVAKAEQKTDAQAYQVDITSLPSSEDQKEVEIKEKQDTPVVVKVVKADETKSIEKPECVNRLDVVEVQAKKTEQQKESHSSRAYLQGSLRSLWSPKLPELTSSNWIDWSTLLQELLMTRPQALKILLGEIKEGDEQYSADVDEDLYYLLHWKVPSSYRTKVRKVKSENGPKGSIVYQMLRSEIIDEIKRKAEMTFKRGQGPKYGGSVECFYTSIKKSFDVFEQLDMPYGEEDKVNIFVMGLDDVKDRHKVLEMIKKEPDGAITLEKIYEVLLEDEKECPARKGIESSMYQQQMKKGCC